MKSKPWIHPRSSSSLSCLHRVTKGDTFLALRDSKMTDSNWSFTICHPSFTSCLLLIPNSIFQGEKCTQFHGIDPFPIMMCDSMQTRWTGFCPWDETGIKYHGMLKTCLTGPKQGPKDYSALLGCSWINDFRQNNFETEKKRENLSLPSDHLIQQRNDITHNLKANLQTVSWSRWLS